MSVVITRLTIAPDGTVSGCVPAGIPPGEHEASIFVVDVAGRQEPDLPLDIDDWPSHDLGPWPEGATWSREDIYG